VRESVKRVWMYPRGVRDFLPFSEMRSTPELLRVLALANTAVKTCPTSVRLVDGKIYVVLNGLFAALPALQFPDLESLVPNIESEHVTLVNSDVVCKQDAKAVDGLLEKWKDVPIDIQFTGFKHTVSLDWAPFSVCVVASLTSAAITQFLLEWNALFGTSIKPVAHVTFAVLPR